MKQDDLDKHRYQRQDANDIEFFHVFVKGPGRHVECSSDQFFKVTDPNVSTVITGQAAWPRAFV